MLFNRQNKLYNFSTFKIYFSSTKKKKIVDFAECFQQASLVNVIPIQ